VHRTTPSNLAAARGDPRVTETSMPRSNKVRHFAGTPRNLERVLAAEEHPGKECQLIMKRRSFRICDYLLVVAGLFMFTARFAQATDAFQLSGSYQIVHKTDLGPQTHVRLQLHLTNHGQRLVHIQRLTLWDLPHADKGATQACSIVVLTGASADTTQEFTIPSSEYRSWRHGARPRLLLQVDGPSGRGTTQVVRLEHGSGGKVN